MKYIIITAIYLALFLLTVWVVGCTQIIKTDEKIQVNTFLKSVEFDSLIYEPNSLEIGKYKGIPSDVEIVFDPVTKTFKFVAKKGK